MQCFSRSHISICYVLINSSGSGHTRARVCASFSKLAEPDVQISTLTGASTVTQQSEEGKPVVLVIRRKILILSRTYMVAMNFAVVVFFLKTGPFPQRREVQKLTANQNLRRRSLFKKKKEMLSIQL